jgi:hypothetical protein
MNYAGDCTGTAGTNWIGGSCLKTVFQGFWYGPPLGPIQTACLSSFIECGHAFELFTYEELQLPRGVLNKDASQVIPFDQLFYYENPSTGKKDIGPFSDLFRFKLLVERGGWWSDVDTVCITETIPTFSQAWAREAPKHMPDAVGTSQLMLERGGVVAQTLYERCLQISRTGFDRREELGPKLISKVIGELELPVDMNGSSETFYPISWIEAFKLWLPEHADEVADRARDALFMPIYQSFPQFIGLDVHCLPPEGSYLDALCKRLSPLDGPRCDAVQVRSALKAFLNAHDWARDEMTAYCGSEVLADLLI